MIKRIILLAIGLLVFSGSFAQLKDIKIIIPKEFGYNYYDFAQFLPGEKHFAVCSNALTILNTETSEVIDEVDLPYLAKSLSVNPTGDLLLVCANNELLIYRFANKRLEQFYKTNTAELIKGLPNSEYYGSLMISGCFFTGKNNEIYVCIGAFTLLFDADKKIVLSSHAFPIAEYITQSVPFSQNQEVILAKTSGTITSLIKQSLSTLSQTTSIIEDIASVSRLKIRDSLLFCTTGDNIFLLNLITNNVTYEIMMPKMYTAYYNTDQKQYLRKPRSLGAPDTKNFGEDEYIIDADLWPGTSQVVFCTYKGVKFIDIKTGKLMQKADGVFLNLKFSSEGKRMVTNSWLSYKALRVFQPNNMQMISERVSLDNPIYQAEISPNKRWLYTRGNTSANIWDLTNFTKFIQIKDPSNNDTAIVYGLFFLNDSELVVNSGKKYPNFNLSIYNLNKRTYTKKIKNNVTAAACGFINGEFYYADYTSLHIINLKTLAEEKYDGLYSMAVSNPRIINFTKDLVFVPNGSNYKIVNRKTKKAEYESTTWSVTTPVIISGDGRYIYTSSQITKKKTINGTEIEMPTNAIVKIDMANKTIVKDFAESYFFYDFILKNNNKNIGIWYIKYDIANYNVDLKETVYSEYDCESGAELITKTLNKSKDIIPMHSTSDKGKYFALSDAFGKEFKIYNEKAEEIFDLSESNISSPKCFFVEDLDKLILTGSNTSLATFVDLKNKKIIGQLANAINDNYFLITPDLYYLGSKDFIKNIRFKYKAEMFSFEQFDAYLNQPHKVLKAFGCSDSALIKAYETAYLKRMKVLGIKPGSKINFSSIPNFQYITMKEEPSGKVNFSVSANKGQNKLKQIHILNNGTQVYSEEIAEAQSTNYEKTISLEATSGINRFEFIVRDESGLESPRTVRLYNNTNLIKPNLFLIVIASEKFKNTKFDLAYAVKDANDVSKTMVNSKSFHKIEVKKLYNQSFSPDSVKQLNQFLAKATINDVVMVFFAGHGYLDEDLSYYFPTYYTDFDDPKINSVAFKDFEKLFQTIKPIRKLMFIDACFSGEVDEDIFNEGEGDDKKGKDGREIRLAGKTFAQSTAMEMAKTVFSDLRQNSGATIISSAGGTEAAFEGEKWNNGLFTHCLLEGMSNYKADLNKDKKISLSELQKFVAEEVNNLSGGKQTPTYRLENTVLDYQLWE